ncbi:MAG: 50S ribosomal protein L31e [Candidatus Pacearchaeota archaeon]
MAENKNPKNKIEEREYVIPLRREWKKVARYKKTNRAVKAVKKFLARHMKIRDGDLNKIKIDRYLNDFLWTNGIKNPPSKVKVKAYKEEGIVRVELLDLTEKLKFKKAKLAKREKKAVEVQSNKPVVKEKEEEKKDDDSKTEKEEKKAAVVEAGQKRAKKAAKVAKHQTKSPKQKQPLQRKTLKK